MIECKLLPMEKNRYIANTLPYKKYGHYISSRYSIKGLGRTCWVVAVNILIDHNYYLKKGMTLEEITVKCIEFLNYRPKSRYGKKRRRKPLYGVFRPQPYLVKLLTDKEGHTHIQTLLVTENRKNLNFWGEGNKE